MPVLIFLNTWNVCFAQIFLSFLLQAPLIFHSQDGDDADDLSRESTDNSFRDDDANESSESPDDDADDNTTAADIPVDSSARCSSHSCLRVWGRAHRSCCRSRCSEINQSIDY